MLNSLSWFVGLRYVRARSHKFFVSFITWVSLLCVCVGVMMFLLMRQAGHYYVEGVGYATIMEILRGSLSSPWFLLLLAALKLLAA